jgi:hypothetical protein
MLAHTPKMDIKSEVILSIPIIVTIFICTTQNYIIFPKRGLQEGINRGRKSNRELLSM